MLKLKDSTAYVVKMMDMLREPKEEMEYLRDVMQQAVKTNRVEKDTDFAKFLYEVMGHELARVFAKEHSPDKQYLELIGQIVVCLFKLFSAELVARRYHKKFIAGMTFLFQHDCRLFKTAFNIPEEEIKRLTTVHQKWRKGLEEDSMVDVYLKADERSLNLGWLQGKVSKVEGDSVEIWFPNSIAFYDNKFDRFSTSLAPFETKTKELQVWRSTIKVGDQIDAHDKFTWQKSTIISLETRKVGQRSYQIAKVGFRIYKEDGIKSDAQGKFEGYTDKQDQDIPINSPRLAPWGTRYQKYVRMDDDEKLDDDDEAVVAKEGQDNVYAVPRIRKCTSKVYIGCIDLFGNSGCFDHILDLLSNAKLMESCDDGSAVDVSTMGLLSKCITLPHTVFHKSFIVQHGATIAKCVRDRLLNASDKSLREVKSADINQLLSSVESICQRFMQKEDYQKENEELKLRLAAKGLSSELLERRINGMRDLNQIIKNNTSTYTYYGCQPAPKVFTKEFLLDWLKKNGVLDVIWTPEKTHLELVNRSGDIFKLLAEEKQLNEQVLETIKNLSTSPFYKTEALKIIQDNAYHLNNEQKYFFVRAVAATPPDRLNTPDFECVCQLGRFSTSKEFADFVFEFFFSCIKKEGVKDEIATIAIEKCTDMVKADTLKSKEKTFDSLSKTLLNCGNASVPVLRLFKKMIKDEKERVTPYTSSATANSATGPYKNGMWMSNSNVGSQRISYSATQATQIEPEQKEEEPEVAPSEDISAPEDQKEKELTIKLVLTQLIEQGLIDNLLKSFEDYFAIIAKKVEKDSLQVEGEVERKKLFFTDAKYSHNWELMERLKFLQYVSQVSGFKVTKVQLKVIYGLFSSSPVTSDQQYFLIWCRNACKENTLNLTEVGSFLSDLIDNGEMKIASMPLIGLCFIQDYFLSLNENSKNLRKIAVAPKEEEKQESNTHYYSMWSSTPKVVVDESDLKAPSSDKLPMLEINVDPATLEKTELIWTVVLNSEVESVFNHASNLLVLLYTHINKDVQGLSIPDIINGFIERCMDMLKEPSSTGFVNRVCGLLSKLIAETEKKAGTQGNTSQSAITNGELLDKIIIKDETRKHQANLTVSVFTSALVWEFLEEVSYMLDSAPKFVKFKLPNGKFIKESDHGKQLSDIGFKNGMVLQATNKNTRDLHIMEQITDMGQSKDLNPKALEIFNWMFDLYCDEELQAMTKETCVHFVRGCTGEDVKISEGRIQNIFSSYNKANDGKLTREEFVNFYKLAKRDAIYNNLELHNIQKNLCRKRDHVEEGFLSRFEMPRYTMSGREDVFQALLKLLDRNDESSDTVWNLIRMLSTNSSMFKAVLEVDQMRDKDSGKIAWENLLQNKQIYQKVYNFEIIEALLEDSEQFENGKRIQFVSQQKPVAMGTFKNPIPIKPSRELDEAEKGSVDFSGKEQKEKWTTAFITEGGFESVVEALMNFDLDKIVTQENKGRIFDLKSLGFLITLLKVFMIQAFEANSESDFSLPMQKQNSKTADDEEKENKIKTLSQNLLEGPKGLELVESIDLDKLQSKLLKLISMLMTRESKEESLEEKLIVDNALNLWMACSIYEPRLFDTFRAEQEFGPNIKTADDFVLYGLLLCPIEKVRTSFQYALLSIAKKLNSDHNPTGYLLQLCSVNFSKISEYPCRQYFHLFTELVDFYFSQESKNQAFDAANLLSQVIDKIRADKVEQKIQENASGQDNADDEATDEIAKQEAAADRERLMIGLIQLCEKIINKVDAKVSEKIIIEKDLVNEIFKEFLFASIFQQKDKDEKEERIVQKLRSRKYKKVASGENAGNQSRIAAYQLLNGLIKKSGVLMNTFIQEQLVPLINLIKKQPTWSYKPPGTSAQSQKYVGLQNLGAICYMSSMMQQFFMTPAFRYNLMCVDDGIERNMKEYKGDLIDENMLHQMQKLIANLELSERSSYNPKPFCFAFKQPGGQPTDTSEQQDAQEFLNVLFDRLENQLAPTNRKHLVQSIFQGKFCSQMVCQECGKAKNKIENFYNLSLEVQGKKSIDESLQDMIKGEEIQDYKCDGCQKTVNLSKRTLIAETPNILIVHLKRIVFNFNTFDNDKLNTFMEFPNVLDLKKFSYHEVMKKEGRMKSKAEGEDSGEEKDEPGPQVEKEKKEAGAEEEEENPEPIEDDCWEYKLVGVNVHSGSANAGHYWSYINTERQPPGNEMDNEWLKTEDDPWQEYNDSMVADWNFNRLKEDCMGDPAGTANRGYGGNYGKSAYMLFYERRMKKSLKIIVKEADIEKVDALIKEKSSGRQVFYDEADKEHYKMVPYSEGIDSDAPNQIYKEVNGDNAKLTFETDVYSQDFFKFLRDTLESVASLDGSNSELALVRINSLRMAKKVLFDILARCTLSSEMKPIIETICKIVRQDDKLAIDFLREIFEEKDGQHILDLLLANVMNQSKIQVAHLLKFLLAHVKLIEKDALMSNTNHKIMVDKCNIEDNQPTGEKIEIEQPVSVVARCMNFLVKTLTTQVAQNWSRMEVYLEILYSFGVFTPDQILDAQPGYTNAAIDRESDSVKIGMHYYLSHHTIEKIGDFMLEGKSPYLYEGEVRPCMGTAYTKPELGQIMNLFNFMISQTELLEKYPLDAKANLMFEQKDMLEKLLMPLDNKTPNQMIFKLATDNLKMTRNTCRAILGGFMFVHQLEKVKFGLTVLKQFILMDDGLKTQRIEWLFGVSEPNIKRAYNNSYQMPMDTAMRVNDDSVTYPTSVLQAMNEGDSFLTAVYEHAQRTDAFSLLAVQTLMELCLESEQIARYVYALMPPSHAYAHYHDWFKSFLAEYENEWTREHVFNKTYRTESLKCCQEIYPLFITKMEKFLHESQQNKGTFTGHQDIWMSGKHAEVIEHYPPQFIMGKQINAKEIDSIQNEKVIVKMYEVECEYNYSNPTGRFNLSCPGKQYRGKGGNYETTNYRDQKENIHGEECEKIRQQALAKIIEEKEAQNIEMSWDEKREAKDAIEVPDMPALVTFPFNEHKLVAPLILRIEVSGIANGQQDLFVKVARKNPQEPTNLRNLASMPYFKKLWNAGTESVCHLVKIDPSKPFDALSLEVIEKAMTSSPPETSSQFLHHAAVQNAMQHRANLRIDTSAAHPNEISVQMMNACEHDFDDGREIESEGRDMVDKWSSDDDDEFQDINDTPMIRCRNCQHENYQSLDVCANCFQELSNLEGVD